jgi:hypothetical protein
MRPPLAAAPALAAALLACASSKESSCPGQAVATLTFAAALPDPAAPPASISPGLPATACQGGTPPGGYAALVPASVAFTATLALDPASTGAALCKTDALASPLLGERAGETFDVSLVSTGAVLAGCDPNCGVVLTERVHGTLATDPASGALSFSGYLWDHAEEAASPEESCGGCALPCDAVYALTGTAPAPH